MNTTRRPAARTIGRAALVAALAVLARPALASPRAEALRLVPADVGFCLVVQDLRDHLGAFQESPFLEQFAASPLGQAIRGSREFRKLAELNRQLKQHLDVGYPRLRDDVFGDVVVLAYRPAPDGDPSQEQGLLVLKARDAELLAGLVERLNALQRQTGELKGLETRTHQGVEYHCRKDDRNGEQFYYRRGGLLAFTSQEPILRQAIELDRQEPAAEVPLVRQLERSGAADALAALWVNPRAFDAELARKAGQARGPDADVSQRLLAFWKSLDGIALTLTPRRHALDLGLTLLARAGEVPPAARPLFAAGSSQSELWARFPEDALFATAGRFDAVALTEFFAGFLSGSQRRAVRDGADRGIGAAIGLDVARDLLPNLGPDVGTCVFAPAADDKDLVPPTVGVLRVRPGAADKRVDQAVFDGLNSLAVLAVFGYNSSHPDKLSLRSVQHDSVEVKYLVNDEAFPAGFRPAFALKDGYLVLASSPDAVRRFSAPADGPSPNTGETLLLRASLRSLARFLQDRQEAIVTRVAEKHQLTAREVTLRLQGLLSLCRLLDRVELTRRSEPGRLSLRLRLGTEQPLKK